jgi:ribonuclease HII
MNSLLFCLNENLLEAGCDEAGRGCLAGPVVAAAVILRQPIEGLMDSKKLNEKQRQSLRIQIENEALSYAVAVVSPRRIEEVNILNASIEAMQIALSQLKIQPEYILIDGNRFKSYENIPHTCVIKGDDKFQSIAAASILAKTYRDEIMQELHREFPEYQWKQNKGYPTIAHRLAIEEYGACIQHRKTFQLLSNKL